MRAGKRMTQHVLRPLFDAGGLHCSSSHLLEVGWGNRTGSARVRLKPCQKIIRNLSEPFLPRFRCARIDADRALMKVKIFPPKFVNLLRPQTREGADRQDWKVFWRCHGEKSAELFNRESRHMVADHRRFINKLNHVCGRVAPAEGKRPHRAQNGTDRKSTRLNSSHRTISYAVFCLKKKKK